MPAPNTAADADVVLNLHRRGIRDQMPPEMRAPPLRALNYPQREQCECGCDLWYIYNNAMMRTEFYHGFAKFIVTDHQQVSRRPEEIRAALYAWRRQLHEYIERAFNGNYLVEDWLEGG